MSTKPFESREREREREREGARVRACVAVTSRSSGGAPKLSNGERTRLN